MDPYIYRLTRFILLLLCLLPSLICFLLIFFFLFRNRDITSQRLHNHFILALLIANFILITTELPVTLLYSYHGHVQPQNDQFCSFWVAYNYGLYVVGSFLMAFGSIERYFLIFHERFMYKWRLIFHYIPIVFFFVYPLLFYSLIIGFYPCENVYDYESYVCAGSCFQFQPLISTIDYIINAVFPTVCITVSSLTLLFRVIYQKRAMKVANTWRKYRLMYVQLLSISLLYFIIWIPFVSISLVRLFYDPLFLQDFMMLLMNYCLYIYPLASPFICLIGLPTVRRRLKRIWCLSWMGDRPQNRIRPMERTIPETRQHHIVPRRQ